MGMQHPFLDKSFIIRWSELRPECVVEDITHVLEKAKEALEGVAQVDKESLTFENTLLALEAAINPLDEAWGKVAHLDSVCNSDALRKAYNEMLPQVSAFYTAIFLNQELWEVVSAYSKTNDAKQLEGAKKRFLEETLADFKEHGADLDEKGKERLKALDAELAKLTQKYSENVLDSTNAWELIIEDESRLKGLPESAKNAARQDALSKGKGTAEKPAWRFTLQAPSYLPVLQYAEDEAFRKQVWEASISIGEAPYDNAELIPKILKLRHDKAQLLGQKHFADFVLKRRMAKDGKTALQFTEDLHKRTEVAFKKEIQTLEIFKAEATGGEPEPLEPWDMAFWAEKQRKALYDYDEELLRPYFPLEGVIEGLFTLTEKLFGISVKERSSLFVDTEGKSSLGPKTFPPWGQPAQVWHPQVKFYDIMDRNGTHLGAFYTDWYPRESKRGGAWMNHLITGGPKLGNGREPHLGLICGNLTPPIGDKPALLNHREVETLFHEFGHLLHHILGDVEIKSLNGTNVAWDFVELPSQIMENWCWERESLDLFAKHYETGEKIPEDLFQKMKAARNYLAGVAMMRQLSFGRMDLELHMFYDKYENKDIEAELKRLLEAYTPRYKTQPPTIVRRFNHLFSGPTGYAAGYYSYKWAEVLDADAFTRFKNEGILNPDVGAAFRQHVLSRGNTEDPAILFERFMGRGPDLNALLERSGLVG